MSGAPPSLAAVARVLDLAPDGPMVVAVSGGGDSLALLMFADDWAAARGRAIHAVTVDHGLRPGSAAEAAMVADICAGRGIAHTTRTWDGWDGRGNLQDAARRARIGLIGALARRLGAGAVALGHTLDDQAETVLMRLGRGSGVDGLSAMAEARLVDGISWLRPMLGLRRDTLREMLRARGVVWAEDPSNDNPAFERVKVRAALGQLAMLGITPERLAETARAMARARMALEQATADVARQALTRGEAGDLWLGIAAMEEAPRELRLRLLAGALGWVSGAAYRPRLASLEAALDASEAGLLGGGMTLHGCVLRPRRGGVTIRREPARVAAPVPAGVGRWDGRWEWTGAGAGPDLVIGALGAAGLRDCGDWRARGASREALLSTPALWSGDRLVSAPLARPEDGAGFRRISAIPPPWDVTLLR